MPAIHTSAVSFNASNSYSRYLTSEGTSYTRREPSIAFNASAATQAADGTMLDDFLWFHGRSVAELPSQDELASRIQELGKNLTDLRDAPALASYSGPVLAEGDAAPQMFRLMFLPDLIGAKQTINGMQGMNSNNTNQAENPFLDRVGARVLPESLTVVDNPLIAEYQGHHMAAQSKMDEDGMLSREVHLIDNGILKTLLMSRDPVRGFEHTTGSRHAGQAAPSNVIVTSSAGLSAADLRAKFIDLIQQRNRPFGIVVRRLRTANNVVLAYKVFPDGHEELVRGLQFVGMNPAAFKDIVAGFEGAEFPDRAIPSGAKRAGNDDVVRIGGERDAGFARRSFAVVRGCHHAQAPRRVSESTRRGPPVLRQIMRGSRNLGLTAPAAGANAPAVDIRE